MSEPQYENARSRRSTDLIISGKTGVGLGVVLVLMSAALDFGLNHGEQVETAKTVGALGTRTTALEREVSDVQVSHAKDLGDLHTQIGRLQENTENMRDALHTISGQLSAGPVIQAKGRR